MSRRSSHHRHGKFRAAHPAKGAKGDSSSSKSESKSNSGSGSGH